MKNIERYIILGLLGFLMMGSVSAQNREDQTGKGAVSSKPASPDVIYVKGVPAVKVKRSSTKKSPEELQGLRSGFTVSPAYPNPFTRETRLTYRLPADGTVKTSISDLNGRILKTCSENKTRGTQVFIWDGTDDSNNILQGGLYLCKLEYAGRTETLKMLKAN